MNLIIFQGTVGSTILPSLSFYNWFVHYIVAIMTLVSMLLCFGIDLSLWISSCKLWLHVLYGLYGPWCLLSPKKAVKLTHSLDIKLVQSTYLMLKLKISTMNALDIFIDMCSVFGSSWDMIQMLYSCIYYHKQCKNVGQNGRNFIQIWMMISHILDCYAILVHVYY